jgi:hypothetical protein
VQVNRKWRYYYKNIEKRHGFHVSYIKNNFI